MKYTLTNENGKVILELDDSKKNLGIDITEKVVKEFAWKSKDGSFVVYTKSKDEPPKGKNWVRSKEDDKVETKVNKNV